MANGHLSGKLREAWARVAEHAGVPDHAIHLFEARSDDQLYGAMHYPPGMWAVPLDRSFAYSDEMRSQLYELRDEDVLVVDEAVDGELLTLLLRHECEHVLQDIANPAIGLVGMRLYGVVDDQYYVAIPHERDADAAATALGVELGISITDEAPGRPNRMLYNAPWESPDVSSLPVRLLAFSLVNPEAFDRVCTASNPYVDPDELLERLVPGARDVRAAVGSRFVAAAESALQHDHDDQSWAQLSQGEKNALVDELRGRLVEQERAILSDIRPMLDALG